MKKFKMFKASCIYCIGLALLFLYSIIDRSFWRGFGDDELIIVGIILFFFWIAIFCILIHIVTTKLERPENTETEPKWFETMYKASFAPYVLILLPATYFSIVGFDFFGKVDGFEAFFFIAAVAFGLMTATAIIPTSVFIIGFHFYRARKRRKYAEAVQAAFSNAVEVTEIENVNDTPQ